MRINARHFHLAIALVYCLLCISTVFYSLYVYRDVLGHPSPLAPSPFQSTFSYIILLFAVSSMLPAVSMLIRLPSVSRRELVLLYLFMFAAGFSCISACIFIHEVFYG